MAFTDLPRGQWGPAPRVGGQSSGTLWRRAEEAQRAPQAAMNQAESARLPPPDPVPCPKQVL